jgi:hypothetical protein
VQPVSACNWVTSSESRSYPGHALLVEVAGIAVLTHRPAHVVAETGNAPAGAGCRRAARDRSGSYPRVYAVGEAHPLHVRVGRPSWSGCSRPIGWPQRQLSGFGDAGVVLDGDLVAGVHAQNFPVAPVSPGESSFSDELRHITEIQPGEVAAELEAAGLKTAAADLPRKAARLLEWVWVNTPPPSSGPPDDEHQPGHRRRCSAGDAGGGALSRAAGAALERLGVSALPRRALTADARWSRSAQCARIVMVLGQRRPVIWL